MHVICTLYSVTPHIIYNTSEMAVRYVSRLLVVIVLGIILSILLNVMIRHQQVNAYAHHGGANTIATAARF